MQFKKILSYFFFVFLIFSFYPAFANKLSNKAVDKKMMASPILTPISGLTINSSSGQISITNSSGKDIPVTNMLLSFSLDQASIAGTWGSPWLNWQPYQATLKSKLLTPISYQFSNQAQLTNDIFSAGSTITFQYSPQPWNNTAVPTSVQLFNLSYPLSPAVITSSASYSGGINTITITNTSGTTLNLSGAQLKMSYQGQISSTWGTPWLNWSVATSAPNYVLNAGVAVQIPPNGTILISFTGDALPISNISLWVQNGSGTTTQGDMTVNLPAAPAGVTANPSITVTGPSSPQGQVYSGTWGQQLAINNLQVGSYVLSTADLQTPSQTYTGNFAPNPVTVSGTTPASVALSYTIKAMANLKVQMPAAPSTGIAAPSITLQGPAFPSPTKIATSWGSTLQVCANGASSCSGLTPGSYTLSIPNVYTQTFAYAATGFSSPVIVAANQTITLPITYAPIPNGNFTVTISAPSLTVDKKNLDKKNFQKNLHQKKQLTKQVASYAVTFTNTEGFVFTKTLASGANTVSLPVNDTYQIAAPNVSGQVVTVTPASLTVTQTGTPPVSIQYSVGAATKFVVYYGGWEGDLFDLNNSLPSNVTTVNLAFANITSSLQVDTAASGWLTNVPASNVTMQPSYVNWTVYKYNHPKATVLLSIGGSTYSAIWNSVLTAANADAMAQNIAAVINTSYPVYKGNISYPSSLLGTVTIDGVDLDVETGVRLTTDISNNVALLTTALKRYLNPGKLITFAAFSVGADPNTAQCTVPGSVHCGEDIPLLQSVGNLFDWINLMAYDAGQAYATSLYQVALANYAQYLPKNKILLGLDIQSQWPGFNETAAQLATKAAWQQQNGYAGAMFWGVDVQNNPTQELQFVTAIASALN